MRARTSTLNKLIVLVAVGNLWLAGASTTACKASSMASTGGSRIAVEGAGEAIVNGIYTERPSAAIPEAFALVCRQNSWPVESMWQRLARGGAWWEAPNGSYIYYNHGDSTWWMDSGETGLGLYVARGSASQGACLTGVPSEGWRPLQGARMPLPTVRYSS